MDSEATVTPTSKKRKISPEFRIAFRLIWCFGLFFAIIYRWTHVGDLMEEVVDPSNLNLSYSKEIDVENYLMTREQLKQLAVTDNKGPFMHWEVKQTGIINDASALYFVVRLKNRGNLYAWGRLQAHSERWLKGTGIEEREIFVQLLPPEMMEYHNVILAACWEISGFDHSVMGKEVKPVLPTDITFEWVSLYTSKNGVEVGY